MSHRPDWPLRQSMHQADDLGAMQEANWEQSVWENMWSRHVEEADVSVLDPKRGIYVPGAIVERNEGGATVKLLLDDVRTQPVQWYPYHSMFPLREGALSNAIGHSSQDAWQETATGSAASQQLRNTSETQQVGEQRAEKSCGEMELEAEVLQLRESLADARDAYNDIQSASARVARIDQADLRNANAKVAELEEQVIKLRKELQEMQDRYQCTSNQKGTVRLFVQVCRSFDSAATGYLSAAEGDELVALHADEDWLWGFKLLSRQSAGWFKREDVMPSRSCSALGVIYRE